MPQERHLCSATTTLDGDSVPGWGRALGQNQGMPAQPSTGPRGAGPHSGVLAFCHGLDSPLPSLAATQEGEPCALEVYRKQDSDGAITVDLYQTWAFPRANGLYAHTLTHMHAVTHVNAYTCMHAYTSMSMHTHAHAHAHTCIHSNACTYMHTCTLMCSGSYTHSHACTRTHTCIQSHIFRHMHHFRKSLHTHIAVFKSSVGRCTK